MTLSITNFMIHIANMMNVLKFICDFVTGQSRKRTANKKIDDVVNTENEDEPVVKQGRGRPKKSQVKDESSSVTTAKKGRGKQINDVKVKDELSDDVQEASGTNNTGSTDSTRRRIKATTSAQVKKEIKEEDDAQQLSTSSGTVQEVDDKKKKSSKKKVVKEDKQEEAVPGKSSGGKNTQSQARKKKSGGKENVDTNNIHEKKGGVHVWLFYLKISIRKWTKSLKKTQPHICSCRHNLTNLDSYIQLYSFKGLCKQPLPFLKHVILPSLLL